MLWSAIESLGVAPSADIALPATAAQPLPATWIWLLRLKGMSEEQRASFLQGRVELSAAVESAAWETIKTTLTEHRDWYASAATANEDPSGADMAPSLWKIAREVHRAALEVTAAALAQIPGN